MALWTRKQFATLEQALEYLNGALIGTVNLHTNGADVDGKTFIVNDGTADRTVTFSPAKSRNWTLDEIVAQINAHANLSNAHAVIRTSRSGGLIDRRLAIFNDPAYKIRGNGTANSVLGFPSPATPANDSTQVIIANTDVEVFRSISRDPNQQWVVVHYT